ncbi:ribonuclease E inhibitor RraA/Dimethylmenaquinone methyltransferase [Lipomyces kononenkoae]|uniref:Ribonuclease E inhibitor RraA/Dimethylmenaquinone methyltransferase n=1 Tax=Lipomyces kononenkoae TaxID=34357 RepID=A0ACC3SX24_LIPKO
MAGKPSGALIQALKAFTTCDIGDALIKLKYPYGGFLDGISMFSPERQAGSTKIFGEAITVKMVDASDKTSPSLPKHFCDYNEPGKIMFISQPPGMYSACWGGLMTTRAKYLGAEGVIVDGRFRDILEQREMGFPVFARGISILGSNGFTRSSEINVPVRFKDNLWINPGDYLMGDADGVVVVPASHVESVVELCRDRKAIDDLTFESLRNGEPIGNAISRLRK